MKSVPLVVAGRRVDAPGAQPSRFAPGDAPSVQARIEAALRRFRPSVVITSGAAGADLLALDAAIRMDIPVRMVLPFGRLRFREVSVSDRGPEWAAFFDQALRSAQIEEMTPPVSGDDAAYAAATHRLVDVARAIDREAIALVVWDLAARAAGSDQSAEFVRYAHALRLRVVELTTKSEDDLPWERTVFVMMPFGQKTIDGIAIDFDAVYDNIYAAAIASAGTSDGMPLFPTRADRGDYAASIDEVMYRRLELARLTLADVTGANANVMFELGVRAKSRSSGSVIVTQKGGPQPPPFDIGHVRVIPFDPKDGPASCSTIGLLLNGTLRSGVIDSPVAAAQGVRSALEATSSAPVGAGDALVATLMREAEDALRSLDETGALNRYESVLKRVKDTEVEVRAAALCVRLGFFDRAVAHADAAIKGDPQIAAAYRERGIALERKCLDGRVSLAKAVALDPHDYDTLASYGGALRRHGDDRAALESYEQAAIVSRGAAYPVLNVFKLKQKLDIPITDDDRALLDVAKMRRGVQTATATPQDVPWSFFDLADIAVFSGHPEEWEAPFRLGALFAGRSQLKSYRAAISFLPVWATLLASIDAEIAKKPPES